MKLLLVALLAAISYAQTATNEAADGTTNQPDGTGEASDTTNVPECKNNEAFADNCVQLVGFVECDTQLMSIPLIANNPEFANNPAAASATVGMVCAETCGLCPTDEPVAPTEPVVITQKLTTTVTFEGVDDCTAAIPFIKKACAGLVVLPEAQVTVTAGAGCDDSGRRQLSGGKEFNIEMEGSDAQINAAETTVKAPDFKQKMNAALGAIVNQSGQGNDHPMAGVSATVVSEPMKTAVTNSPSNTTTKAPEEETSGISTGLIAAIVIFVLILVGAVVFYMISQNRGDDDKEEDIELVTDGENTTYE